MPNQATDADGDAERSGARMTRVAALVPGLADLRDANSASLRADALAGVTLWAMLVPQSLGFAVLAGLPPVVGLYAGLGAMLVYWLWGSSRHLNVGAESTVAIMVATIVGGLADPGSDEYVALTAMLAVLVGLILLVGGALRLGRVADFLSRPVLAGYVFGSGVLIVTSQLQGFFGTSIEPEPYLTEIGAVVRNLDQAVLASVVFGAASVVVILLMRMYVPAVPGALVAVVGSIVTVALFDVDVAVVGQFDGGLPTPGLPDITWSQIGQLIGPAVAVALLVFPDSVLTARSLAASGSDRVNANREFFGLGAANIGAGLMGGFPVNGSQSRSFVIAAAGGRSQVANLAAVVLVALTLLFLAPIFDYLPTATLAGIVIVAGIGLFDIGEFRALWRYRRSEFGLALLTVAAVLGLGMLVGILAAIALSLLLVIWRVANPHSAELGLVRGSDTYRDTVDHPDATTFDGLLLYRFDAPIFFANAGPMRDDLLRRLDAAPSVERVVFDMESVHDIDSTGAQTLGELLDELDRRGVDLELARVRSELLQELAISHVHERLTGQRIHLEVDDAVAAHLSADGGRTGVGADTEEA